MGGNQSARTQEGPLLFNSGVLLYKRSVWYPFSIAYQLNDLVGIFEIKKSTKGGFQRGVMSLQTPITFERITILEPNPYSGRSMKRKHSSPRGPGENQFWVPKNLCGKPKLPRSEPFSRAAKHKKFLMGFTC
ncbi:hypothetical protein NQ318_000681 [Aromia moschata]|uniref:Uncharacterized protein n=1 Tax=Aromia moschata TaxID=1265417 RepID=A0AAV8XWX4_9CUCU|nr:hypothetical protein NQ318_000681 [Aromia moschata]